MAGRHHRCNGHELVQTSGDGETGRLGVLHSMGSQRDRTGRLNNNNNSNQSPVFVCGSFSFFEVKLMYREMHRS